MSVTKLAIVTIAVLGLAAASAPVNPQQESRSTRAFDEIRAYLARLEGYGFSGGLLVGRAGVIEVEAVHGLADRERNVRVERDTLFDVGSVSKQFTAAAIIALESDGKLRVTDAIEKYFGAIPDEKRTITIHHLLTHTSGLAVGFGGDYERVTRDEIVRRALASQLLTRPGERHAYSNAGYSLLAAIVEIVSKQPFETFIRERLFRRAGMTASGYLFPPSESHRFARGYRSDQLWGVGSERALATNGEFWNLIGNGGVHSTLIDMYRWMVALERGRVVPAAARDKLFHPHVVSNPNYKGSNRPLHYGYGWNVWKQPSGKTLIWHLGGNNIFNAAVRYHVDDRRGIVYLTNVAEFHDPKYPVPVVERMLAGDHILLPPQVSSPSPAEVERYTGRYRAESGALLAVDAKGSSIRLQGEGQEAFSFVIGSGWKAAAGMDALNSRIKSVVEKTRLRDYQSLHKAFEPGITLQELTELEDSFWRKRQEAYGAYVGTRVLGTIPSGSARHEGTTVVAIDFQRGTAYHDYLWTRTETLDDLGPLSAAPSAKFFPISEGCFARVDPASAEVSKICFSGTSVDGRMATIHEGDALIKLTAF
jgi:CubicO group peptidase (beta-lactamase class C family)